MSTNDRYSNDPYNEAPERLWEKLAHFQAEREVDLLAPVDMDAPFPIDQVTEAFPQVKDLVKEVEREANFDMSEYQCSWAVAMMHTARDDGISHDEAMEKYNQRFNTNLAPRQ